MKSSFIQQVGKACAFTLAAMITPVAIAAGANAGYSWTEILIPSMGPLGGVFGINDYDQVAVTSADGSKTGIYRNGIFTPLARPPAGYKVTALGINNAGAIVGGAFSPSDPSHEQGFVLRGSRYTFLSQPGWSNTSARAISQSGLVTGYSYDDGVTACGGFIYTPRTGTFTDATPPGSGTCFSVTQGMNADGRITGDGRLPDLGRYGFVWQQQTIVKDNHELVPFLTRFQIADTGTAARGINDAGIIVGLTSDGPGFVGSESRGFRPLVPPGGDAVGAIIACEGINNANKVACEVTDAAGNTRGFIGSPDD